MGDDGYRSMGAVKPGQKLGLTIRDPDQINLLRPDIVPGIQVRKF